MLYLLDSSQSKAMVMLGHFGGAWVSEWVSEVIYLHQHDFGATWFLTGWIIRDFGNCSSLDGRLWPVESVILLVHRRRNCRPSTVFIYRLNTVTKSVNWRNCGRFKYTFYIFLPGKFAITGYFVMWLQYVLNSMLAWFLSFYIHTPCGSAGYAYTVLELICVEDIWWLCWCMASVLCLLCVEDIWWLWVHGICALCNDYVSCFPSYLGYCGYDKTTASLWSEVYIHMLQGSDTFLTPCKRIHADAP